MSQPEETKNAFENLNPNAGVFSLQSFVTHLGTSIHSGHFVAHIKKEGFTPEWAERMTSIPASTIRTLAEQFASAKPAAIFCNAGDRKSTRLNSSHRT